MYALASWPRLLAAASAAVLIAFTRLHVHDALLVGDSIDAMRSLAPLVGAVIYVSGTLLRLAASRLRPSVAGERIAAIPAALATPLAAAAAGLLSASGPGDRLTLALAAGAIALIVEWSLERATRRTALSTGTAAVGVGLLLAVVPIARVAEEPTRYRNNLSAEGAPPHRNVVVIGVDGVDWAIFQQYLADGRLPNLARLADEGVAKPLRTLAPTSSPFIWNSIYTGYSPAVHHRRPPARSPHGRVLVRTPRPRRLPDLPTSLMSLTGWEPVRYPFAIWDILAGAGYDAAVVGAWEFSPVPTRHTFFTSTSHRYEERWRADRHLALGPSRRAFVSPELRERIRERELPAASIPREEWAALFGSTPVMEVLEAPYAGPDATPVTQRIARARAVYATDRLRVGIAETLMSELAQPYFLFLYIRGIDVVQHCYLHHYRGAVPDEERGLGDVIGSYHEIADAWIGRIRERMDPRDVLFVLSDHGFNVDEYQPHDYKTGFHDFAPTGIFLSNVEADSVAVPAGRDAHVFDVTPTLLTLLGLPVLASMEGRVIEEVTPRGRSVSDWRTLTPAVYQGGDPEDADPELLELLKSLGYL